MKKVGLIIAVALFACFAIADLVHDFVTNDPIHFFSEQPRQLLVVAAFAIGGGLIAWFFCRLSRCWQRKVKLLTLGSVAVFATLCFVFFAYQGANLSEFAGHTLVLVLLCNVVAAALLWFEFYQTFRSRVS